MSFIGIRYHAVFSTKERRPWLAPDMRPRLCEYMAGIVRNHQGHPLLINGPEDHVHLVLSIPVTTAVADFMRELKSISSGWVHQTFPELRAFAWQDGYAIFSVSSSVLPKVLEYVQNQEEHHKKVSFRDELIWLLKNHGVEFDEKYI